MLKKRTIKKRQIALQAYELLVVEGVDEFSLNQLLERISMSKGNFYHYFKNKDELFCEAIKIAYEEILQEQPSLNDEANFEEKLSALFYIYLDSNKEIDQYMEIINQMYYLFTNKKNTYLYNYMQEVYAYTFYELERIIKEEIKKGNLNREVLTMVKPIVATADGMLTHSFLLKDYNLQEELKTYFKFINQHYSN